MCQNIMVKRHEYWDHSHALYMECNCFCSYKDEGRKNVTGIIKIIPHIILITPVIVWPN